MRPNGRQSDLLRKIERKQRSVKDEGVKIQLIQCYLKHEIKEMAEMA